MGYPLVGRPMGRVHTENGRIRAGLDIVFVRYLLLTGDYLAGVIPYEDTPLIMGATAMWSVLRLGSMQLVIFYILCGVSYNLVTTLAVRDIIMKYHISDAYYKLIINENNISNILVVYLIYTIIIRITLKRIII